MYLFCSCFYFFFTEILLLLYSQPTVIVSADGIEIKRNIYFISFLTYVAIFFTIFYFWLVFQLFLFLLFDITYFKFKINKTNVSHSPMNKFDVLINFCRHIYMICAVNCTYLKIDKKMKTTKKEQSSSALTHVIPIL
jgi:hypothetical protein